MPRSRGRPGVKRGKTKTQIALMRRHHERVAQNKAHAAMIKRLAEAKLVRLRAAAERVAVREQA
jgi:hypothetical protein